MRSPAMPKPGMKCWPNATTDPRAALDKFTTDLGTKLDGMSLEEAVKKAGTL
jgi:hypothetical protein